VWEPVPNSALEVSRPVNTTTVSAEGTVVTSSYSAQTSQNLAVTLGDFRGFLSLGSNIAGVSDTLWLAVQRISGTTETFYASMRWRENA
jgi:hypothetical protein